MRTIRALLTAFFCLGISPGWAWAGQLRSPHTVEACLECHAAAALKDKGAREVPVIVVPEGNDPHRVLVNSCASCHPKDIPSFWLIMFPRGKGLPQAPSVAAREPGKETFANPHDRMKCEECHKNRVSFEATLGGERELVNQDGDMSDFCRRCHQETVKKHFPRGNVPTGAVTCLACHRAHRPTAVSPALREDYYTFIRETTELNPHGGNLYCLACHTTKPLAGETPEYLFGPKNLDRLCQRCHADVDHHVIGKTSSPTTWRMDFLNYPLSEGRIGCLTCHTPHPGEAKVEGESGFFLRGEPYPRMIDFCQKCHEEKNLGRLNPHDQMTPTGEIIERSCLFCHVKVPDMARPRAVRAEDFNDTLTSICTKCHEPFPHPDIDHILQPGEEMAASIKAYEGRRDVVLPLDFDGRITCVTCHNPHEKGLMTGPDAVGADEVKKLRLTTTNEICTPCHGRH